jgi:hypothetical protein
MADSEDDVSIMEEDEDFMNDSGDEEDGASEEEEDDFLSEDENDRRGVKGKAKAKAKEVPKKPAVAMGKEKAVALADRSNTIDIDDIDDGAKDNGVGKSKTTATGKKKTIEEMYQSKCLAACLLSVVFVRTRDLTRMSSLFRTIRKDTG